MKTHTTSSLLLFVFISITSTLSYAQRNVNHHKNNKESTIVIDESNVYDANKDEKRQQLFLKDSVSNEDFSKFVHTVKTIKNPSLIDENADLRVYSRLFMDTYQKHFNITNGIKETIVLAPQDNNRLYLVGKLDNMPNGITALLFYAFEGTNIQFSKLVTFNNTGTPIATQNVQYYIKGSQDQTTQKGKTTCKINSDNTMNCIDYMEKEGEKEMVIKSETMYQIQEDGSIKEIGSVDLEAKINTNTYKDNKAQVISIDKSNVYDSNKDKKQQLLFLKNGVSKNDFSAFVQTVKTIKNPTLINEKSDLSVSYRIFLDTYQKYFNITNEIKETVLLAPSDNNSLYLIGKLDNMPNKIHALLFYAFEGKNIKFSKLITFDETGMPIATKNIQYHIKSSEDGLIQKEENTCQINLDNTMSYINYTELEGKIVPKSETKYQIQEDGTITKIGNLELKAKINTDDNKTQAISIDESNVYDTNKDKKRQLLFLKDGISEGDFSAFVQTVKTIKNPALIDEKTDLNLSSRLFMDTYQKYFNITNGLKETVLLAPKDDNSLYLVGKLDSMPNGIHALLFYALEGANIQFSKLITFDETGTPIAAKNIRYNIKSSEDGFAQEGKTTCQLNSDQTISCTNYTENNGEIILKSEKIYQVQEDGSIKEIRMVDLKNK